MTDYIFVAGLVLAVVLFGLFQYYRPRRFIVRSEQCGVRYHRGQIVGEVGPGRHWVRPQVDEIEVFDSRRRQMVVSGQEILTLDHAPVKVSLLAEYSIADVLKASTITDSFKEALYARIQIATRDVLATRKLDDALVERIEMGESITDRVRESVVEFGLEVHEVQVRDFMLAANLRHAFADVVVARQQGLAALEKARGETAAIRKLANSAQLMERHPGIMQLRLLQAVENSPGNRVVIALDPERGRFHDVQATSEVDT